MARLTIQKDNLVWNAWMDLFEFHKAFGAPEPADEYWESAMKARNALRDKYKETEMENLVASTSWTLMEIWHEMLKGGKKNEQ